MAAPFPAEAIPGGILNSQAANTLYHNYVRLAQFSERIIVAVDIDLSVLAALAFVHSRLFGDLTVSFTPELRDSIRHRFSREGMLWATAADMVTDLQTIRAEALLFHAFVRDNVPEARVAGTITHDPTGNSGTQVQNTLPKPHAVEAEIAKVRALFD